MAEIFSLKEDWKKGRKKSKFEIRSFNFYYNKFKRLYCSVYQWTLPEELKPDVLENYLFEDGLALIWKHELLGWIITRGHACAWDVNNRPIRFRPRFDANTENYKLPEGELTLDECIPVYDTSVPNVKRSDSMFLIEEIVDISETIRIQTFNQKTPLMAISGTQQQRQKNLIDIVDIQNNVKVMTVDEDISASLKVLDFNAPFNVEKLNALRNVRINEILENGGIDAGGSSLMKQDSARLLTSQVEANAEILNYILADGLKSREKAADKIAEMIGPCSVTVQGPVAEPIEEPESRNLEENTTDGGTENDAAQPDTAL